MFWAYKDRTIRRLLLCDPAAVDLKAVNSFKTTAINSNSVLTLAFGHLLRARNMDDGCEAAWMGFWISERTRNSKQNKTKKKRTHSDRFKVKRGEMPNMEGEIGIEG